MKGTAFFFPKANETGLQEYDIPTLEDGELLLEIECSGVSMGTERQIFYGQDARAVFPVITGYQSVGTVIDTKGKTPGVNKGDRVLAMGTSKAPGLNICWGSHVSHSIVGAAGVVRCPKNLKPEVAALAWVAAVGNQGADKVGVKKGDVVAIIGQGIIGQMAAQNARVRGAKKIFATDVTPLRVEMSNRYSADVCVNANEKDIKDVLFSEFKDGADVVYEATGKSEFVVKCLEMVKSEGAMCYQGWYPGDITFPFDLPHTKQVKMAFPFAWGGNEKLEKVARLMADGKMHIEPLITHRISYKDAPRMYPDLVSGTNPGVMAVVIDWRK